MINFAKAVRSNSVKSVPHRTRKHKSTGPRTLEGKERSSLNAFKHGLCSERPFFPGESSRLYDTFRKSIFALLVPKNLIQADFAERIASSLWRLRRSALIEDQLFTYAEKQLLSSPDVDQDTILAQTWLMYDQNFMRLRRYQVSIERTLITMLTKYSHFCRVDDQKSDEDRTASVLRLIDSVKFFQQATANSSKVDLNAILDACTKPEASTPPDESSESDAAVPPQPTPSPTPPPTPASPPKIAAISTPIPTPTVSSNPLSGKDLRPAVAAAPSGGVRSVIAPQSSPLDGGPA